MAWCLIPKLADKFKQDIIDGKIDPKSLSMMSSAERNAFFSEQFGGDNATRMNELFESKLLLKNQQRGIINWAKQMLGDKPDVLRDTVSTVERMQKVLSAENETAFLEDLAAKKLGTHITYEEATKLSELSTMVSEAKEKISPTEPNGSSNRLEYGAARVALQSYVDELKLSNKKDPLSAYLNPAKLTSEIAGAAKGIKASLDDSAVFRQGWKTFFTNPTIWAKNAIKTFLILVGN